MLAAIKLNIIPFLVALDANKKIQNNSNKIEKQQIGNQEEVRRVKISDLKKIYKDTILAKNILEDKIKQNISAITVASTLIVGLLAILGGGYPHLKQGYIAWVVYVISLFTILYMITAGYLSILTLAGENTVHKISIKRSITN
ncbi:MAG: hypothetical protein PHN64_02270 [Desulfovibrionaceae bacterium]|nr:hypothetical protein [Desulfovibrionaceae bacterium]